MVLIGAALGSAAGSMGGRALAKKYLGNDYVNEAATIGGLLGGAAGALTPFKNGGRVTGRKKGKGKIILAHVGEYVLPIGVKPTKSQMSAVASKKRKSTNKR